MCCWWYCSLLGWYYIVFHILQLKSEYIIKIFMQIQAYIAGRELEKFQRGDKTYHRVINLWKWQLSQGETRLKGFKEKEDAEDFKHKYL